jgi:hypothetical protein
VAPVKTRFRIFVTERATISTSKRDDADRRDTA